jgi:hypothetical protein
MTRFAFKTPEWLEVGIHPAKVPELAVVVVRTGDDSSACRVDREGRHSLLFATGYVSGFPALALTRNARVAHLGMVFHDDFVGSGQGGVVRASVVCSVPRLDRGPLRCRFLRSRCRCRRIGGTGPDLLILRL